nr:leucine-rich repeat extensin-like protein 3 [Chlorocebus sabaeus]
MAPRCGPPTRCRRPPAPPPPGPGLYIPVRRKLPEPASPLQNLPPRPPARGAGQSPPPFPRHATSGAGLCRQRPQARDHAPSRSALDNASPRRAHRSEEAPPTFLDEPIAIFFHTLHRPSDPASRPPPGSVGQEPSRR